MKFDYIIGNPPYQIEDKGNGKSAKPVYNEFVKASQSLNPEALVLIIPARWFTGGKGLKAFRQHMLNDTRITSIVDYQNAKDCFPGVSIGGGVCYFSWVRDHDPSKPECKITNIINGEKTTRVRSLSEYPVYVRYNEAVDIIEKVKSLGEDTIVSDLSSRNPYGISTKDRGKTEKENKDDLLLYSSKGEGYISREKAVQGIDSIDKYKVMISRTTSEHAGEPDKSGMYKVISKMIVIGPESVCTDTYIIAHPAKTKDEVENFCKYLKTKFVRFLILQNLSSINLSKEMYSFVPVQDFTEKWTDEKLYKKYRLNQDEINYIESVIKEME